MNNAAASSPMNFARSGRPGGAVHIDTVTISIVLAISLLGLVMVTSASVSVASHETGEAFFYMERQLLLMLIGAIGFTIALPGMTIFGVTFDAHTLLFASLAILCGFQAVAFAVSAKAFAMGQGFVPPDARIDRLLSRITLERVLIVGSSCCLAGGALLGGAVWQWWASQHRPHQRRILQISNRRW